MMARIALFGLLGVLFFGTPSLRADSDSSWVGVWRVELQASTPSVSLLVVTKEGDRLTPAFYGETWQPRRLQSWELDEDSLVLDSNVRARPYRLELTRKGDRLSGVWSLMHPQFRDRIDVTGQRIFAVNHWDPNEGLRRFADASRFIDISQFLIENAPLQSFAEFQEYWDQEVKIPLFRIYYPILYHSNVSDEEQSKRLRSIWETIRSDRFRTFAKALAEQRSATVKEIREKHPELYFANHFVSMPSAGAFETRVEQVEDEAFVLVATESLMETISVDQLRHWLIRWQLKLPLFSFIPPNATSIFATVVGEGIAAGWSVKMGFAKNGAEALGVSSLGDATKGKEALQKIPPNRDPEGVPETDLLAVAAEFGSRIAATYSIEEILSLSRQQWMELYVDYPSE